MVHAGLGDINIGLLFGCGPLFAELINEYAVAQLDGVSEDARRDAERQLQDHIFLLGELRRRRRLARAAQRRELAVSMQTGFRDADECDQRAKPIKAESPEERAIFNEELQILDSDSAPKRA